MEGTRRIIIGWIFKGNKVVKENEIILMGLCTARRPKPIITANPKSSVCGYGSYGTLRTHQGMIVNQFLSDQKIEEYNYM